MSEDYYSGEMHALRTAFVGVLTSVERLRDRHVNVILWNRFEVAEVACRSALSLMPRTDGRTTDMEVE